MWCEVLSVESGNVNEKPVSSTHARESFAVERYRCCLGRPTDVTDDAKYWRATLARSWHAKSVVTHPTTSQETERASSGPGCQTLTVQAAADNGSRIGKIRIC